ncbi:MAG: hypothetical protein HY361_04205 [Candidatus Aenigmarchaeota archaeon]|nr:hypothetical protein [Candidatus Aenigmarchaeota archaeon]
MALWGVKIPKNIRTTRAEELRDRYDRAITSLTPYTENPDVDTIITNLREKMAEAQCILDRRQAVIDQRLLREQYGDPRRIEREAYRP